MTMFKNIYANKENADNINLIYETGTNHYHYVHEYNMMTWSERIP
jgi:hypothetical protein